MLRVIQTFVLFLATSFASLVTQAGSIMLEFDATNTFITGVSGIEQDGFDLRIDFGFFDVATLEAASSVPRFNSAVSQSLVDVNTEFLGDVSILTADGSFPTFFGCPMPMDTDEICVAVFSNVDGETMPTFDTLTCFGFDSLCSFGQFPPSLINSVEDLANLIIPDSGGTIGLVSVVDVPEPGTLGLLWLGLLGLVIARRRRVDYFENSTSKS